MIKPLAFWMLFTLIAPLTHATGSVRLVVLAPDIAHNLIAIGAGDNIVGIIDNPALKTTLPQAQVVGDYQLINIESVLSLEPDYIIVWDGGNSEVQLSRLEALGFKLVRVKSNRLEDLPKQWQQLAELVGKETNAAQMSAQFSHALEQFDARSQQSVRVFYQLWHSPLMSVNREGLISEILTLCGAENVMALASEPYPQIGTETVLAAEVDLILASDEAPDDWPLRWKNWPDIPAVKHDQLYTVETDYLHQLTNDTLKGINQVCSAVEQARKVKKQGSANSVNG